MGEGDRRRQHVFANVPPLPVRPRDPQLAQGRLVVAMIGSLVIAMGAVVTAIGLFFGDDATGAEPRVLTFGPFEVVLSTGVPAAAMIGTALLVMVGIAAFAVTMETLAALLTVNPRRRLLSQYRPQRVVHGATGPLRITVLVPAHNEEASLPITLTALGQQTRPPDAVLVVADNCTDATVEIARRMGHEAYETVANTHRKGGALNQALSRLLPTMGANDLVMVMDADTSLGPRFLEVAEERLTQDPELTAVGGVFYGEPGHGLIGQFQRNEYARYSLQIKARHGRVFVMTGTASIFRAEALMDVAAGRGVFIPGIPGKVYDTAALTEDNELTLALKSLGATMASPLECRVTTEIMPTWNNLWVQRKRWQRGALENLAAYGITLGTIRYWGQQVGLGYGAFAFALYLIMMGLTVFSGAGVVWLVFWIAIGGVFLVERVATAWGGGWRARLLALALLPELAYALFLHVVFVKCLYDITIGQGTTWGHVQHAAAAADGEGG